MFSDVSVGSKPAKSSGGGNCQSHHRGSRRREPSSGSLASLSQARPGPRAKAGAGKRPPARGNNYQQHLPYYQSQLGQADECELGSIFNPGIKKHNSSTSTTAVTEDPQEEEEEEEGEGEGEM